MQAFIAKVAEWVLEVEPATVKWVGAVLLALFFGLVLFAVYQYQAHNREWGLTLVVQLCVLALLASVTTARVNADPGARAWKHVCRMWEWGQHQEAIRASQFLVEHYPDCPYAEDALFRTVDFYVVAGDYASADRLLAHVFALYPDVSWVDRLVLRQSMLAYQKGDYARAKETAWTLLCEYPSGMMPPRAMAMFKKAETALANRDHVRTTALHLAAFAGDSRTVASLLAVGAQVNARDDDGQTPLHAAAMSAFAHAARVLLAAGADVNARDSTGATPLDVALAEPRVHRAFADKDDYQAVARALREAGGKTGAELDAAAQTPTPEPGPPPAP